MLDGTLPENGSQTKLGDVLGAINVQRMSSEVAAADTSAAIAFLRAFDPEGRHNLIAIDPKSDRLEGRTFKAGSWSEMAAWIVARTGRLNLYFTVNEPTPGAPHSSLKKHEIARIRGLYADCDFREHRAAADERLRLERLVQSLDGDGLTPTAVIESGGGIQCFWWLPEKLDVADHGAWAENQGRALALRMGGDAVQNLNRFMRLPGTMNLPNADKLARGRTAAPARVIADGGPRWAREQLQALLPPVASDSADTSPRVQEVKAKLEAEGFDDAIGYEDLEPELRARFEALCATDEALRNAWRGEPLKGADQSGSAYRAKLASHLGRASGFSAIDYARLAWVCPHTVQARHDRDVKLTARALARDWVRVGERADVALQHFDAEAAAALGSDPVPVGQTVPSGHVLKVPVPITARPDPADIPVRRWLVEPLLPIGDAAQVVGEPGSNKSTFTLLVALAVATGDSRLLEEQAQSSRMKLRGAGPVLVYNAEDSLDEMHRRLAASMSHYGLQRLTHPITLWSGLDHSEIVILERGRTGAKAPAVPAPAAKELEAFIKHAGVRLVVLDPQVSLSRGLAENDTDDMNALAQEIARMASRLEISILVVHHTTKQARNKPGDMGASRGAFSQAGKYRSMSTLTAAPDEKAEEMGELPGDVIYLTFSKVNHGRRPKDPFLFRRHSVAVGNGRLAAVTAADHFNSDPVLVGDYAPVLEIIGHQPSQALAERHFEDANRPQKIGQSLIAALDGRATARLTDILSAVQSQFLARRISKSKDRSFLTDMIRRDVGSGLEVETDGQTVRVSMSKDGTGPKAPWVVSVCQLGVVSTSSENLHASDATDASLDLFA